VKEIAGQIEVQIEVQMFDSIGVKVVEQAVVIPALGRCCREVLQGDEDRQRRAGLGCRARRHRQPQFGLGLALGADDGQVLEQRGLARARVAKNHELGGLFQRSVDIDRLGDNLRHLHHPAGDFSGLGRIRDVETFDVAGPLDGVFGAQTYKDLFHADVTPVLVGIEVGDADEGQLTMDVRHLCTVVAFVVEW
jgi:hypothetical protein